MRKIVDMSYDNRINVQTLYQRIRARKIPVVVVEGRYAVEDEYVEELLRPAVLGRKRKEVKVDEKAKAG